MLGSLCLLLNAWVYLEGLVYLRGADFQHFSVLIQI